MRVNQQHSSFDSQSKSEEAHLQECKSRLPKKEKKMLSANNVLDTPSLITWAIVGDVLNQDAPAYNVANSIEGQGRILYRLSPTIDAYDSSSKQKQLYRKLADIPPDVQIDAINLCVNYRIGLITILEMKKRGIKYAFIQPGADHNDLIEKADELGIIYQRGCMIVSPLCELSEDEKRRVQEMKKSKESGCGCVIS